MTTSAEYKAGWDACEAFYTQAILSGDPGFKAWLDKLEEQARRERDGEVECSFCDGTGTIRTGFDPQTDIDCKACAGNGTIDRELLEQLREQAEQEAAQADCDDYEGC
jgi:RecJ-like exonuclease